MLADEKKTAAKAAAKKRVILKFKIKN